MQRGWELGTVGSRSGTEMGGVMRDAERLGIRNCRIKVRDRDGWRRILGSAKTLRGL
jgi:hypothetical protein